jgi:hypothetical protein
MGLETPLTVPSVRYSKIVSFRVRKGRVAQPNTVRRMEVRGGIEPPMKVFETLALPFGYRAGELLFPDQSLSQNRSVRGVVFHSPPPATSVHLVKQNRRVDWLRIHVQGQAARPRCLNFLDLMRRLPPIH